MIFEHRRRNNAAYMMLAPQPTLSGQLTTISAGYPGIEQTIRAMRGLVKDITERHNLLRELGETHHLLEATFEQSPVPFVLVRDPASNKPLGSSCPKRRSYEPHRPAITKAESPRRNGLQQSLDSPGRRQKRLLEQILGRLRIAAAPAEIREQTGADVAVKRLE